MSVVRSADIKEAKHGFADILNTLLNHWISEAEHGMALSWHDHVELIFLRDIILLGDHDALRASLGCKGAAGSHPCVKCRNCLSHSRAGGVDGFVDITEHSLEHCRPMTQDVAHAAATRMAAAPNKRQLEELEKLLGWNWQCMSKSLLLNPRLQTICTLKHVHFDSMHDYWSNGIVSQELGLWWRHLQRAGLQLKQLQDYVALGWQPVKFSPVEYRNPSQYFTDKLFKDADYRGDSAACLAALPLCVSFSEEILRETLPEAHAVIDSLKCLWLVTQCLQRCKSDYTAARSLPGLQQKHMKAWEAAYSRDTFRPKHHFALHLGAQVLLWERVIDCFVTERKHRAYKQMSIFPPEDCALQQIHPLAIMR
eukprot:Skav204954  [mRNA]  locus=scaffold3104:306381:307481:- [translate_table: standard]